MSIAAFEGGAGCGKTTSVMDRLAAELTANPLGQHQRVLALTYMHGARHRLDEQLEKIQPLAGRYDASTIDSFAWTICRRWQSRLREYGHALPAPGEPSAFEAMCNLAARLLEDVDAQRWVRASYPYILVDEAQDLDGARLALVGHLAGACTVILAFDDFQCLNSANRPVAVVEWIKSHCTPTILAGSHRTNVGELLLAANQIRGGQPVTASGSAFKIRVAPARRGIGPVLAATLIGYEVLKGGTFAILSPARLSAPYVKDVLNLLATRTFGKDNNVGPFRINAEGAEQDGRIKALTEQLKAAESHGYSEAVAILEAAGMAAATQTAMIARRLRDARGQQEFNADFLLATLYRQIQVSNQFGRRMGGRLRAMTIHQAKNREFDRVAVLWPYTIPTEADDRRRLLYNAVTRARRSCLVVVQAQELADQPPFT